MQGTPLQRWQMLRAWLFTVLAGSLLAATPAAANVHAFEAKEYAHDFGVTPEQAKNKLEIQDQGAKAGIVEELEGSLGNRYAGLWFDNKAGEFVVPALPSASRASIRPEFADADIANNYRIASAQYSWEALEAAHKQIDRTLLPLIKEGLVQTSLDPRTNAVVVEVATGATEREVEEVEGLSEDQPVAVEVQRVNAPDLTVEEQACNFELRMCGYPLRGGVSLQAQGRVCTTGFKAIGNTYGNRFIITAGHCADDWPNFWTYDIDEWNSGYTLKTIGPTAALAGNYPASDWAVINANGSKWDGNPWPSEVAYWGVDQQRAITSESSSYLGEQVCHSGVHTASSCGYVSALDKTVPYDTGPTVYHLTQIEPICSLPGDSGGPAFIGNTALGIYVAAESVERECSKYGYYHEITDITNQLGVSVAPGAGAQPYAETWDATNILGDHVSANGKVDPNGMPTTYRFEYGTTTAYGSATESYYAGAAMSPSVVSATISGLQPGTTYHYRISSSNGLGQSNGDDHTFKTNGYRYMLGTSSGGTTISSWNSMQGEMNRPVKMGVGDFTGDKKADIIAVESEGAGKYRYKLGASNGSGIGSWSNLLTGMSEPKQMAVGDVTGDGKADVVSVESEGNGKYRYMLGAGVPTYASTVNADAPVSYWRLGEISGTTAADERATNPGTYQNSPTQGATSLLATDTANKAVSLDGTNDNVKVASSSSLQLTSPLSLEAWIKPTSLPPSGSYATIIAKPGSYVLEFDGPRLVFTIFQGGVLKTVQAPEGALVAGQAYHVVGTYDGTTQRLYVNGTQVASTALSGSATTNANPLYIGSWDGSSAFFKGTIDEPAVYKTALAGTRIGAHYEAGISTGTGISWNNFALTGMSLPTFMRLGDVNGDGKADVVSVESEGNGKYRYMLGISTGTSFSWGFTSLTQMSGPWSVSVGDVTGDKKADVVAVEDAGGGSFRYMIGTSTGTNFTWGYLLTGMSAPYWMALGDVNKDGKADIVANESEGGANYRYMFGLSTGGTIWPWGSALTGLRMQEAVGVGDFTGDGNADVIGVEAY